MGLSMTAYVLISLIENKNNSQVRISETIAANFKLISMVGLLLKQLAKIRRINDN